jgi:hypothetical protein
MAGLAAVALLLAACSSSGSSPAPVASVATSASAGAPSVVAGPPPAPTNFSATRKSGSVPCPSADPNGDHCYQDDFAWQASSDPEKGFRVYEASFGFDPNGTCAGAQADAKAILDTKPGARSAQLFAPMAVGGGQPCYWITAVNSAGESAQVPAAGN